jgi:hypothetical protein
MIALTIIEAIEFLVFVAIVIAIIVRSVKRTEKNNTIAAIRQLFFKNRKENREIICKSLGILIALNYEE